jgi:hypothetical protein
MVKATPARVNRAAPSQPSAEGYGRDLADWPRSWMGVPHDLPPGEHLVVCFRPFLTQLAASPLSPKTIRQHVDNLWRLGGEIIRDLNEDPPRRKIPAHRLLRQAIDADGGPLLYHGSEDEQRSFDSTCRKLHRFLRQPQS